jgi:hypothetical protein
MHAKYPAYLILLDLIAVKIFGEMSEYENI